MSNSIKIALIAMVVAPALAIWLFWGRFPTGVVEAPPAASPSPSAPVAASVPEVPPPAAPTATAPSPPALTTVRGPFLALEPAPASSSLVADSEARARMMLRHRPALLKGMPAGCDPPFFTDSDGNKRFKQECF
jgi:hypothetical protein